MDILEAIKSIRNPNTEMESHPLISQRLIDLCNYRIEQEEYSSRIYLAMSNWLDDKSYSGAAKLWKKYSQEELAHADIIYDFLLGLGITPVTPSLQRPPQEFESLMQIVQLSFEHEIEVYNQCVALAKASLEESQLMLYPKALKLTEEQHEEVEKLIYWIDMFKSFGTDQITLLHIDEKMGEKA